MIPGAQANVIFGHGVYMIRSMSRTSRGIWITGRTWAKLPETVSDIELGDAVLAALEGALVDVPHPERGSSQEAHGRPFAKAMGFGSTKELMKGARAVGVEEDGHRFRAFPSRNNMFTGEVVWSPSLQPADVGRATREAIERSS